MLCFKLCFTHCTALQMKNRNLNALNAKSTGKKKPEGSYNALSRIDIWRCQQKELQNKGDKSKSMMHTLYVLRLVKRHISGRSDVEQ